MTEQPWDSARLKALDKADGAEKRLYLNAILLFAVDLLFILGLYNPVRLLQSDSCADLLVGRIHACNNIDRWIPPVGVDSQTHEPYDGARVEGDRSVHKTGGPHENQRAS
jgi:hypothetical protein